MGFKCGVVGLPNVGKSTLFNALTNAEIPAENYPFCTIDPNIGVVPVCDPRLDVLADLAQSAKRIPTAIEFVDIAGLVAGASEGEGLGNLFLSHIRNTDAIAHVVRCFEDGDITHVAGKVDPLADIETIETELLLADLETVSRALEKTGKQAKSGNKAEVARMASLEKLHGHLGDGKHIARSELEEDELALAKELCLITRKPMMLIANIDDQSTGADNPHVVQVKDYAKQHQLMTVTVCARLEAELIGLSEEEKLSFLQDAGMERSGLDELTVEGYRLLDLLTFFTAGPNEARAWTVQKGACAPQAAGRIHTDFERGFIRAEVIAYDDYVACKGEQGAKDAGKWRLEGKDYVMVEGDVTHFRFNT